MNTDKLLFRLEQPHGAGDVYTVWQPGTGIYLATTGIDAKVNIFDRYGKVKNRIALQTLCTGMSWDRDGDLLAIICQNSQLILWDANSNNKYTIDVKLKDGMTCLMWAKTGPILALGTTKGNLSIYNHQTSKRIPIIGKHSKKIICGAWNNDDLLALGSEDRTISLSNIDGDTLKVIQLRAEPSHLQFSEMKVDERIGGENTISVIVGRKTLYLYNINDPDNPIELAFQQHYGNIVIYKWFGDGYILIGFNGGYLIAISTHIKEVGQELFQVKNHKTTLNDIAVCEKINKLASCGDNTIKVHDLTNLQEVNSVMNLSQESGLDRISWSYDGQLMSVCTKSGSINVFVSYMPLLTSVYPPRILILTSLTEVSLYNYTPDKQNLKAITINLRNEPNFIAVGPYYMAAGLNNRIWFYDLTKNDPDTPNNPLFLNDRQYLKSISDIKLNQEYAAVLFDGKIQLHLIEQLDTLNNKNNESEIFPDDEEISITCYSLTSDYLIYGTDIGNIDYFSIEEWSKANQYQHTCGIIKIYSDLAGTRLIFIDSKTNAFIYNGLSNNIVTIPNLPNKINQILWDTNISDRNIFIISDDQNIYTYVYVKLSINGSFVRKIGKTLLNSMQIPLLMFSGEIVSVTSGSQLTQFLLTTHDLVKISTINLENDQTLVLENNFQKQLNLNRFNEAYQLCQLLDTKKLWKNLAEEALYLLEIEFALKVYMVLEDVSMVNYLQKLLFIEDYRLLCGYIQMLLKNYDKAQKWFLESNEPQIALEMRRDLLQWDQALQLAKKFAPEQIALISREYAQQLEFTGNYSDAHMNYEKALQENLGIEHIFICKCGLARTFLHCHNYRHGISVAIELNDKNLLKECAEILEKHKQLKEAGELFVKCDNYDRAAINFIKLKNWSYISGILPKINSQKILLQYAKAKEDDNNYSEAAQVYLQAKDYDSVVRLQLDHLNNPEVAVELVQETKSIEGAKMVAKFFQRLNDYNSAIQFLVLSHCMNEAFGLARKYGKMELYGEVLLNSLTEEDVKSQDFASIALYFENERNHLLAGKYWFHAKDYNKAMKSLLKATNSKEKDAITIAIDVVASSKDDNLMQQLIDYLLGETDGIPKDPKYLFRLYMAKKQYREASKSALIIANEEQINGNYRNAHDVLFSMYQELKRNSIKIPNEMYQNLMLLHSYILARIHHRRGDHIIAARMLMRISNNISKFPTHSVPILTSAVIECQRANLNFASFKYASQIISDQNYRKQIDQKYVKKIEGAVRKPPKNGEDPKESLTICPYCQNELPETELYCDHCKNTLPFCIATGYHIVVDDLTACPECDFPAIRSKFIEFLDSENTCPMCNEKTNSRRLNKIQDPKPYLNIND